MNVTTDLLHYEDSKIFYFLEKYLLKINDKKRDLFSEKMNDFRFIAEKQNELLNVVMIDDEVTMIYEVITNIKSFSIERFCYEDFDILNQFDGFVEPIYYLDKHFDVIYNLFAKKYKNYLLFNFENSMYDEFGNKSLTLYKQLRMTFKSFFNEGYDRFNTESDYLQSIHSDITNEMMYNTFIESFIKDFDSYEARVYDIRDVIDRNKLKLLFTRELPIFTASNTLKHFGYNLFWKGDINTLPTSQEHLYIVLVGLKEYEEKPLTVLKCSVESISNNVNGYMIHYIETNFIYNELKEFYEKMVFDELNKYMLNIEEELLLLNIEDKQQSMLKDSIYKHMTNPYILDLKNKDEFLKRIKLIR